MHPKFIPFLCCPHTRSGLTLEDAELENGLIISGRLVSPEGASYPITHGVPRFVDQESYSESFGFEWKRWSRVQFEDKNTESTMNGHTTAVFDRATGFSEDAIKGKSVVEFGCGPGRFLDIIRARGGLAIGLELSSAADVARENFKNDSNVCIVQGDILTPPFKPGNIDFGYTIGVIHHTPTPEKALKRLVEVVKPGGTVACSVYENRGGMGLYDSPSVIRYRAFFNAINPNLSHRLALAYAYFSAYVLYYIFYIPYRVPVIRRIPDFLRRHLFPGLFLLKDGRWRVLDTFDAITPKYASTHTGKEVQSWFTHAGCADITPMPFYGASYRAKKK